MRIKKIIFHILCISSLLFSGCTNHQAQNITTGLYYAVENIPNIDEFSATHYENFNMHFPEIASATYIYDGVMQNIDSNDPRLIRLLNFLAYSNEKNLSSIQQGYLDEKQIDNLRILEFSRLEVTFSCAENEQHSSLPSVYKIIICGDSYLKYSTDSFTGDAVIVERYWPYGELVMSMILEGQIPTNALSYESWGTDCWIDLIKYAGF